MIDARQEETAANYDTESVLLSRSRLSSFFAFPLLFLSPSPVRALLVGEKKFRAILKTGQKLSGGGLTKSRFALSILGGLRDCVKPPWRLKIYFVSGTKISIHVCTYVCGMGGGGRAVLALHPHAPPWRTAKLLYNCYSHRPWKIKQSIAKIKSDRNVQ